MELLRRLSLRNADIEVVKRTISEEIPGERNKKNWNNNFGTHTKELLLYDTETCDQMNLINDEAKDSSNSANSKDDDYVVIELLDEEQQEPFESREDFVDINMTSSKQILIYLAKKRRLFVTCRSRAVCHAPVLARFSTGRNIIYLKPFFRVTVSPTEFWYVNHRSSLFIKPHKQGYHAKPVHYTEKVECIYDTSVMERKEDLSKVELTFSDEANDSSKVKEIPQDMELCEKSNDQMVLRRSYSIEFLNEDGSGDASISAENIASKIEEGNFKHVYEDSTADSLHLSDRSFDSAHETSILKRSFSIEFLNEDEEKPFSCEVVHYKIEKGEGVLIYSDVERMNESADSSCSEDEKPMKRSYSIEFLNENEDSRCEFTYETVSNKIEMGEGKHIYDDGETDDNYTASQYKHKRPIPHLKTLGVKMDIVDEQLPDSLQDQEKQYRIELLNEQNYVDNDQYDEEEIVPAENIAVEASLENEVFNHFDESADLRFDDSGVERKSFNVEFLDEKPGLDLDLNNPETSTPFGKPLKSPTKSPLQTVHIGVEFEKRNKSEDIDDNDDDEYLIYEGLKKTSQNGGMNGEKKQRIPSFKLETIVVNMDTHHDRKRKSLFQNKKFQLEFQPESQMVSSQEARRTRIPSESSSLRTVSIETDAEEVIHDESELKPAELSKEKAYSVEYLNEMEGDKSVFYEEFVDDGEPRWTLEI